MNAKNPNIHSAADDDEDVIDLSMLFQAVMKRLTLCAAICGTVIALALAYCFLAPATYLASCRMLVEQGQLKVTEIKDVYNSEFGRDSVGRKDFMATQMKLITSDHILAKVFEKFKFAEKEAFATAREPLRVLEKLIVVAQVPNTSLIDIGFKDKDAVFSAEVSNFLAQAYMDDSRQRSSGFSQRGLEKLQDELVRMEAARFKAIEKLNNYKSLHDILSVDSAQKLGIARITKLDEAFVNAQEAFASAKASVDAIADWRAKGMALDSMPEAIQNPTLTSFKLARLQAQAALVKTMQDFGPGHRAVYSQQQIIKDMDKAIERETENSLVSCQARLEQAKVRLDLVAAQREEATTELKRLDRIADEYKVLEDNLKSSEKAYQYVLDRVSELQIARSADAGAGGTFQIIVPATPPTKAAFPQKAKIMVIAALGAAVLSVLLCILLELLDTTVKGREEAERISGRAIFGEIPFVAKRERRDFVTFDDKTSAAAEAFRAIRTSLTLSQAGRRARFVAVTSSAPNEGKSFTTISLAITYARAGKRVLLVDADMRRRRATEALRPDDRNADGLSSILAGMVSAESLPALVSRPFDGLNLDFLPSGPLPPNPMELISGDITAPFFESLRERYDAVFVDTAPVLAVADTSNLAAVEGMHFLVVAKLFETEKKQLAATMQELETVNANILGVVVQQPQRKKGLAGSYGYGSGYGYGRKYGYHNDKARKA